MSVDLGGSITAASPGEDTYAAIRRAILDRALRTGGPHRRPQLARLSVLCRVAEVRGGADEQSVSDQLGRRP